MAIGRLGWVKQLIKASMLAYLMSMSLHSHGENMVMCSAEFPGFTNKDGSGYYWELLREIFTRDDRTFQYATIPFSRCLIALEQDKVDGVAAFFKTPSRMKKFTYAKNRIHFSSYGLFYLKKNQFEGLENIKGKVGKVRGYDFSSWLPNSIEFEPLKDVEQGIRMLRAGRIIFYAEDLADFKFTVMGNPIYRMSEFKQTLLLTKDLYSAFSKSNKGKRFAREFDKGLERLVKSGRVQALSNQYQIENNVVDDF